MQQLLITMSSTRSKKSVHYRRPSAINIICAWSHLTIIVVIVLSSYHRHRRHQHYQWSSQQQEEWRSRTEQQQTKILLTDKTFLLESIYRYVCLIFIIKCVTVTIFSLLMQCFDGKTWFLSKPLGRHHGVLQNIQKIVRQHNSILLLPKNCHYQYARL